jgi:hypothetical protein
VFARDQHQAITNNDPCFIIDKHLQKVQLAPAACVCKDQASTDRESIQSHFPPLFTTDINPHPSCHFRWASYFVPIALFALPPGLPFQNFIPPRKHDLPRRQKEAE